jgi:hypothetical protein
MAFSQRAWLSALKVGQSSNTKKEKSMTRNFGRLLEQQ